MVAHSVYCTVLALLEDQVRVVAGVQRLIASADGIAYQWTGIVSLSK